MMKKIFVSVLFLAFTCLAHAQYFGKNKPRYRSFDFKVKSTPHFDMYYYMDNEDVVNWLGQINEQWYDYHSDIFDLPLVKTNPIIFYNNHAEFQQTNAISGNIGVGTGGVTEAFKNRVVMPLTYTHQQTRQVLGHELVHAFQYNAIIHGDSTSLKNLANLPLWMVEGMAEYMSLGRVDPFTAMWMRDAVLNDDIPDLRKMAGYKYFPYRYGQAMMSFIAGFYGDDHLMPLFRASAIKGVDGALDSLFHINAKTLSGMWKSALNEYYKPFLGNRKENPPGKKLISKENSGKLNVSPSLSPNGRYVIYLSEKDLFSTDLFMADARSGEVIRKIAGLSQSTDLDNLNYFESAGTWSPNSKQFAFVGFKKGRNVLVFKNVETGKTTKIVPLKGVPAFVGPAWSPDGRKIVVTGSVNGQVDLYQYDVHSGKVEALTNDEYCEIQPAWNKQGDKLAFAYDKRSWDGERTRGNYTMDIAIMDYPSRSIEVLDIFHGADNFNPQFDHEGSLFFISDADGFRNLYKLTDGTLYRETDILTGISGISRLSPALSVSRVRDHIIYTHYYGRAYEIYSGREKDFLHLEVDPHILDQRAGMLPVFGLGKKEIVMQNLESADDYKLINPKKFEDKPYTPKFKLDYIGGAAGVGVANNTFGTATGLQGGIDMIFSDILGNNQLFSTLALNGEILDFGGQIAYLNRKNRLAYGIGLSHIPLRTGYQNYALDSLRFSDGLTRNVIRNDINIIRIFDEKLSGFVHYPFSTTLRLEGGIGGSYRSFRQDLYKDYYLPDGFGGYQLVFQDREPVQTGETIQLNRYYTIGKGWGGSANIALVGDNSFFGLTAPLAGHRFRFALAKKIGLDNYWSFLADMRKYWRLKPVTFALRGLGYFRFEKDVTTTYPFFIGNMGFVRGYGSVYTNNILNDLGLDYSQLLGSKIMLSSAEVRLPFTGPKQLALIGSGFLFTDLSLFFDVGVAFDSFETLRTGKEIRVAVKDQNGNVVTDDSGNPIFENKILKPETLMSAGISMRINLFGALILEPYYAWPLRKGGRANFGLNFIPGW